LALLNTIDHHLHRRLRAQLNPFFSNARIRKQESAIKALVDKLCRRLEELKNTGQPLNIEHALTCYTTDVITNYSMGDGYHYLDAPDFIPRWHGTLTGTAKTMVFIRPVAWALPLLLALPERVTAWLNPGMELFFDFQRRCRKMIKRIVAAHNEKGDQAVQNGASVNIFEDILRSDLPAKNKSETRLAQEMQVLVSAGAETTAKAITYILFYLLNDPETMKKLKAELETVGDDVPLIQLEQLPYLVSYHGNMLDQADTDTVTDRCDVGRNQVCTTLSPPRMNLTYVDFPTVSLPVFRESPPTTLSSSETGPFPQEYAP
jgi:cytochrome P450